MRLRGDINILLLGDPSVGKSQFLKFAIEAAPVGVYTSGKGSSAAGLTASVIRDPGSGEFHLEGGALVLADGGLVCIDEFDKMRPQDRVAIHEAMEQQTISIAKAGITTILNSRASVLAAANPIFSRYDDMKSPTENIDFQTTILSRFDLIFIVRDVINMARDKAIAEHIVNVHKKMPSIQQTTSNQNVFEIQRLKKYIAFARQRVTPRLAPEASKLLENRYVAFRKDMRDFKHAKQQDSAIPITVRQLEAIIRISESLARMELSDVATEDHVQEAIRLFKVSTFQAATANFGERIGSPQFQQMVARAETFLERRVAIGLTEGVKGLLNEMVRQGLEENASRRAMDTMEQRGKFKFKRKRQLISRVS
jgi:DNA replication licensing factor MCM5